MADVLFGDVSPSGKLPITFPRVVGQVPLYYAHRNTGRPPRQREAYTSKYLDIPWTPQYPFGYGLSYTTFTYSAPRLSAPVVAADGTLTVQVDVRNSGARVGDEVVQLYLHQSATSVTQPVRRLRNFTRITLAPGELRTVSFTLNQDDFALFDEHLQRRVEPGHYRVYIGGSSTTNNGASFVVGP